MEDKKASLVLLESLRGQSVAAIRLLFSSIRVSVLAAFVILITVGLASTRLGYRHEDIQVVLFPFVCMLLLVLPIKAEYRPPFALIALSLVLWMGATFNMNVLVPRGMQRVGGFLISRLSADDNSVFVGQFLKRYKIIADTYDLPPALPLAKGFDSRDSARSWLLYNAKTKLFLVRGLQSWLEIVFNPSLYWSAQPKLISRLAGPDKTSPPEKIEVIEFRVPWVPRALLLATIPESINSPAKPREFVLHALGWLGESLRESKSNELKTSDDSLESEASKRDAYSQLSTDASLGLSNGIAAIGQHLHALSVIEEFRRQGYSGEARIDEAISLIRSAASFIKMESDPELFSMLFNNAGVAAMATAESPEELYEARFWIRMAHDVSLFGSQVPAGAEIAMRNLITLDEAEAISPINLVP